MGHMREEIQIEAPVEHVWAFLCDTSRWRDWAPRMETSDWSGPFDQVGTTYAEKWKLMGFEMKQTFTILEVAPLELIHEHSDQGLEDNVIRFEREGDATNLVLESDYAMPGHIPGFLEALIAKTFIERRERRMLQDLKALAEATVPAHV